MDLTFLHPLALWLLVPALAFGVLSRGETRRVRRALRTAVFVCLALALAQPSLTFRSGRGVEVVVLDQSARLTEAARRQGRQALAAVVDRQGGERSVTLVQLGGAPSKVRGIERTIPLPESDAVASLPTALEMALASAPIESLNGITLITDGRSRDMHWDRAMDGALRHGVAVNSVLLQAAAQPAAIADVAVSSVRVGETATATVRVRGQGEALKVVVLSAGRQVAQSAVFRSDGEARVQLAFAAREVGFMPLEIELREDGRPAQTPATRFATLAPVQDPMRVLYVGQRQTGGAQALDAVLGPGVAVEAADPRALATGLGDDVSAVWLDDLPATQLSAEAQRSLREAVLRRGLGLMVSGGEASFGMGGYDSAPIGGLLPVTAPPERTREEPSVALAIVIDTSGSMAGTPLELAKQVARLSVRALTPQDTVGVVEFYGGRQWVAPLQPARNAVEIERAVSRVQAQGGTVLFPALEEAYYGLKGLDARFKHVLVISDAGVNEGRYEQLIRQMAQDRITVSAVRVGDDDDGEARMALWARLGRGRYYAVQDEFGLVQLDLRQPRETPRPGYQPGAVAVAAGASAPRLGAAGAPPPIQGYARTTTRPAAETWLATGSGDPVLASWQYGAGRSTALMTEPAGAGAAAWRRWSGYGDWLTDVLKRTADPRPAFEVRLHRRFDAMEVVIQRLRGRSTDIPEVRLIGEAGETSPFRPRLEQKAPGLFVSRFALDPAQPLRLEVRDPAGVYRAADRAASDISRPGAAAEAGGALRTLSRLTGGFQLEAATQGETWDGLRFLGEGRRWIAADLWSWLTLLALALYLADIVYRRWPARARP